MVYQYTPLLDTAILSTMFSPNYLQIVKSSIICQASPNSQANHSNIIQHLNLPCPVASQPSLAGPFRTLGKLEDFTYLKFDKWIITPSKSGILTGLFHLVNIQEAIEKGHLQLICPLKKMIFHSYVAVYYGKSPLFIGKSTINGQFSIVFCMFTRG